MEDTRLSVCNHERAEEEQYVQQWRWTAGSKVATMGQSQKILVTKQTTKHLYALPPLLDFVFGIYILVKHTR